MNTPARDAERPRASVVIACRDAGTTLAATLASVLSQTERRFEAVVVDDGSTDDSPAVAERVARADDRVRVIRLPEPGGASRARNVAVAATGAPYVAPLDADDLWHPRYLELMLEAAERAPEAGFVHCLHRRIDAGDRILSSYPSYGCSGWVEAEELFVNLVGTGSAIVVPRPALEAVGGYDEDAWRQGGGEDLLLQMRLASLGTVETVPLYLVGYRMHAASHTADWRRALRVRLAALDQGARMTPDLPPCVVRWAKGGAWCDGAFNALRNARIGEGASHLLEAFRLDPVGTSAWTAAAVAKTVVKATRTARRGEAGVPFHLADPSSGAVFATALQRRRLGWIRRAMASRPIRSAAGAQVRVPSADIGRTGAARPSLRTGGERP